MITRDTVTQEATSRRTEMPSSDLLGAPRWRTWVWTFGVATALVLLVTTLWYVNALRDGQNAIWVRFFVKVGFEWYPWGLLTPLIALLVRKYPLDRTHIWASGALHVGVAAAISVLQNSSAALGSLVLRPDAITFGKFSAEFVPYFLWMAPWSIVIYFGIAAVASAFEYRSRLQQREILASRLEAELTKAQLSTLYSQLQPHFLFNTLNSISVLVSTGRHDEAQTVLRRLSDLLRYVLARGDSPEVTVEEEVAFVEQYLSIEKVRFADRMAFEVKIDPQVLKARIPTFLLQTLVENAVRHGLAPKIAVGTVNVQIGRAETRLTIRVEDDGVGISEAPSSRSNGLALANTRSRLEHLYSGQYKLELAARPGGGAIATAELPFTVA